MTEREIEEFASCRNCKRVDACCLAEKIMTSCVLFGCLAWPKTYREMPFNPMDDCESILRNIGGRCRLYDGEAVKGIIK